MNAKEQATEWARKAAGHWFRDGDETPESLESIILSTIPLEQMAKKRCEHCGSDRIYHGPPDCPTCGAPNCCQTCCQITTLEQERDQLQEQLEKAESKADDEWLGALGRFKLCDGVDAGETREESLNCVVAQIARKFETLQEQNKALLESIQEVGKALQGFLGDGDIESEIEDARLALSNLQSKGIKLDP